MADGLSRRAEHETRSPWHAREIARRNQAALGVPLSPVMKTAATARELETAASAGSQPIATASPRAWRR